MRKIFLALLIVIPLSNFVQVGFVYAIPSLTPHSHAGTVLWWQDKNGNGVFDPNDDPHNHRDVETFYGASRKVVPTNPSLQPYSACGVWDNRNFRVDDVGDFDRAHGFINEFSRDWGYWIKDNDGSYGGVDKVPRYRFDANVPASARERIRESFAMYDQIVTDRDGLIVGIKFVEVAADPAEVVIRWQDITSLGETSPTGGWGDSLNGAPVTITFDSSRNWSYNVDPTTVPVGQFHFLTVALHEIGHLVGLDEQNDIDDVMYYVRTLYGFVYVDGDGSGVVSVGDNRIEGHDGFVNTVSGARYAEGTNVAAGDADIGLPLSVFPANEKHDGNVPYDPTERIYLDNDGSNSVTVGDTRMVAITGIGEGGSIVRAGDTDISAALVAFQANEKHTGAGPWVQTPDADIREGVKDLYSIPEYDVTLNAHCNTEGVDVSVSITIDGSPTGSNTPQTFTDLTGTYTFTVPYTDANGHSFKQWSTGATSTTVTISSAGTYTAYYESPPPPPPPVGGIVVPVDKFGLLAPYVGLASTILVATAATTVYVKRVKHRKEKQ